MTDFAENLRNLYNQQSRGDEQRLRRGKNALAIARAISTALSDRETPFDYVFPYQDHQSRTTTQLGAWSLTGMIRDIHTTPAYDGYAPTHYMKGTILTQNGQIARASARGLHSIETPIDLSAARESSVTVMGPAELTEWPDTINGVEHALMKTAAIHQLDPSIFE